MMNAVYGFYNLIFLYYSANYALRSACYSAKYFATKHETHSRGRSLRSTSIEMEV